MNMNYLTTAVKIDSYKDRIERGIASQDLLMEVNETITDVEGLYFNNLISDDEYGILSSNLWDIRDAIAAAIFTD